MNEGASREGARYERQPRNHLAAFLGLAAAVYGYKRLVRLTA
ncbi:hypothetical protein ACFVZD_40825 [Streptomyces sp. NPDC058287]